MLELRPNCECCDRDLDPASPDVFICTEALRAMDVPDGESCVEIPDRLVPFFTAQRCARHV